MNCLILPRGKPDLSGSTTRIKRGGAVPHTVLLVDNDLGFVFWLGQTLDALGHSALPAKTVPDAALLVLQLDLKVDLLVINLSLVGATEFIAAMHRANAQVRVIGIVEDPMSAASIPGVSTTRSKPATIDSAAKSAWIECIQGLLTVLATQSILP